MGTRLVTRYVCQGCGTTSPKWLGRCPECGAWDSLLEEVVEGVGRSHDRHSPPAAIASLDDFDDSDLQRLSSGIPVLDRAVGGGLVPGSTLLLAGEPGIGKSTLLLQLADGIDSQDLDVLYVSAEESGRQLRLRADRLGCRTRDLEIAAETALEPILETVADKQLDVLLVDSIQAMRSQDLESAPGSVSQVRHVANRLVEICKRRDITLILVGHVTKEGVVAGPRSLEHLVDTVLSFEGDGTAEYRILRATKNRFGPTGEVAMFEMSDSGLRPVDDPSRILLSRRRQDTPGSAVTSSLQGLRPLLVEVQALVHQTKFPSPRRMSIGCDPNRVVLLVAVLERFGGLAYGERDVFVNVVGGLSLREPAADLAICAALASAQKDRPLPEHTVFVGEMGLLGEVRPVSRLEARLREAAHLGYDRALIPRLEHGIGEVGLEVQELETLADLLAILGS